MTWLDMRKLVHVNVVTRCTIYITEYFTRCFQGPAQPWFHTHTHTTTNRCIFWNCHNLRDNLSLTDAGDYEWDTATQLPRPFVITSRYPLLGKRSNCLACIAKACFGRLWRGSGDGELIDLSGSDSWPWKKQQRVGIKARCKETASTAVHETCTSPRF